MLSSCTDFKRAVGIEQTSPDEFAVESRAPLTIPPDFDLRPPQPGARRPQEPTSADKARQALEKAGPGEPGNQAPSTSLRAAEAGLPNGSGQSAEAGAPAADQVLSSKLLDYSGAGAAVEKRDTEVLKGVY